MLWPVVVEVVLLLPLFKILLEVLLAQLFAVLPLDRLLMLLFLLPPPPPQLVRLLFVVVVVLLLLLLLRLLFP